MKIRSGFVSNSSSASYIIKIHNTSFEEFSENLMNEYGWYTFNPEYLKKEILADIDRQLEYVDKQAVFYNNINKTNPLSDYWTERIDKCKEFLKELENPLNNKELIKLGLEYNGIKLAIAEDINLIQMHDFTVMHNSFDEGMTPLVKEITFYFMSLGKKVELDCERDE